MKRFLVIILSIAMVLSIIALSGCQKRGQESENNESQTSDTTSSTKATPDEFEIISYQSYLEEANGRIKAPIKDDTFRYTVYEKFATITQYLADEKSVIIPDTFCDEITGEIVPIVCIERGVFAYNENLESVTFGKYLTHIDSECFRGCANLKQINYSDNLLTVGTDVFRDCTALETAFIPSSLTAIGSGMFSSCSNLTRVFIEPDKDRNTDSIGCTVESYAFENCFALSDFWCPADINNLSNGFMNGVSPQIYIYGEDYSRIAAYAAEQRLDFMRVTIDDFEKNAEKFRSTAQG